MNKFCQIQQAWIASHAIHIPPCVFRLVGDVNVYGTRVSSLSTSAFVTHQHCKTFSFDGVDCVIRAAHMCRGLHACVITRSSHATVTQLVISTQAKHFRYLNDSFPFSFNKSCTRTNRNLQAHLQCQKSKNTGLKSRN